MASKQHERVVRAVRRLAAEGGLPAVQMREVAASADLPLGSVRHVFPSKDEMLAGLAVDVVEQARARADYCAKPTVTYQRMKRLLPLKDDEIEQVRLEHLMHQHSADPNLRSDVREAFRRASQASRRLVGATCEGVLELAHRATFNSVARPTTRREVTDLIATIEGLRMHLAFPASAALSSAEAAGVIRGVSDRLSGRRS
ncbi:TetR family transcriptional regulator [Microbacterium sp. p3-SID338]|uniref:TetR family transcriptional regulator n=1 Tax=Microbacterium sp. p3-SID338 TaxID=2916214 RepID=UPI0037C7D183